MRAAYLNLGGTVAFEPGTNLFPSKQIASAVAEAARPWKILTRYETGPNHFLSGNGGLLIEANNGVNGSWARVVDWGQSAKIEAKSLTVSFTADKAQFLSDPGGRIIQSAPGRELIVSAYVVPAEDAASPDTLLLTWDPELIPAVGAGTARAIPSGATEWRLFHVQRAIAGTIVTFLDELGAPVASYTYVANMDFEWRPVPWAWNAGTISSVQLSNTSATPFNVGIQWRIAV